jgi:hypothetical protein
MVVSGACAASKWSDDNLAPCGWNAWDAFTETIIRAEPERLNPQEGVFKKR